MAAMIGLVVLGLSIIFGGVYYLNGALKKHQQAERGLGSEINKQLADKRAANEKVKQEAAEKRLKFMAGLRKYLAEKICEGNEKVAEEIIRELETVNQEADKLFADADSNNDPTHDGNFYAEKMEQRVVANSVIFHWLGGRVTPKQFCMMLFGQERETAKERGKVADFLTAGNYSATGTGFYVAKEGWILTNEHVVSEATEVDVRGFDGVIRRAKVVKTDRDGDVAVLKTQEAAPKWLLKATNEGTMGSAVFTIGYPNTNIQGVEPKFTDGRISSLSGIRDDPDHYQITVPAQPGNSGGPLVDAKTGAVVGIVASVLRNGADNVTYAIKIRVATALLKTIPDFNSGEPSPSSANKEMETMAAEVRAATLLIMVRN